jgi:hypothetical protein
MSGVINTGSFPKRLWPGVNMWYGASYKMCDKEYTEIFDVRSSDKRYEEIVNLVGMGLAETKSEGGAVKYDSFKQGLTTRFTHVVYGKGFVITKEMQDDDQYSMALAKQGAEMLSKSMLQTKETICANILNNGFVTTFNTGGDALALFSASHTYGGALTFSNTLSVAADLSEASLEQACIDIGNLTDDAGLKIAVKPKKLIVNINDTFNAKRILGNSDRPATADRDINALVNMGSIPGGFSVNHYLTDSDAWFLTTDCPNGLVLFEREGYELTSDNDFDTGNAKFKVMQRYVAKWGDPRGIYGSPGA